MPTTTARVPQHTDIHDFRVAVLSGKQESYGTVLVAVLCQHFSSAEWFEWEPDVLFEEVKDDFHVEMPQVVRDKIWALVACLATDSFWTDALFMNHVANALTGGPTNMEDLEPAEAEEIAWAIIEVGMSDLDEREEPEASPEIKAYVGAILDREGLPPVPPMEWARAPTGFNPGDPSVAAMEIQDRQEKLDSLRGFLSRSLGELHEHLQRAGVGLPGQKKH